jgi:hypothetical protein
MIPLLVLGAAHAACDESTTVSDVESAADALYSAFGAMDAEGVASARARLQDAVPCLGEAITANAAAHVHVARGMSEFTLRNSPAARADFAAARSVVPGGGLPDVVAEGNPIWKDYEATDLGSLEPEVLPTPADGTLILDGRPTNRRLAGLPVIVQVVDAAGTPLVTALVESGGALPSYAIRPERERRKGPSVPLLVGAAASTVVAGGLGVASAWSVNDFDSTDPQSWTDAKRTRTNALAAAAYGTGAVAAGLGTAAFVVRGKF